MNAYIPKQFDYWPTLALENCEIGDVGIGIDVGLWSPAEMPRLLAVLTGLATATADEVAVRRATFVAAVTGVPVAQPA